MIEPANPYEPPSALEENADGKNPATQRPKELIPTYRYWLATVATLVFLIFGFLFLVKMVERSWLRAAAYAALSLSSIPWAAVRSKLGDCLLASLMMPPGVLGSVIFCTAYLAMFEFPWFERVFNNDGLGPLGLIAATLLGFIPGGIFAWWLLSPFMPDAQPSSVHEDW